MENGKCFCVTWLGSLKTGHFYLKNDNGSVASVLPFTNVAFQQVACDSKRLCVVSKVEEAMKDRWKNGAFSFQFSSGQNRKSRSLVVLCSETTRKRLLRRISNKHRISFIGKLNKILSMLFLQAG